MTTKLRAGDRVEDSFLGLGTVQTAVIGMGLAKVLFDVTPPREYNLGTNPCMRPISGLRIVEVGQ